MDTLIKEITDLIPQLESDKNWAEIKGGYYYYNQTVIDLISKVSRIAGELSTDEYDLHDYNEILEEIPGYDGPDGIKKFDGLTNPQLLAFLICIIRAEHFCEGTVYGLLQDGRLIVLLKRIRTVFQ